MEDVIKKPSHYCSGRQYEPKDVIRDWDLNFNLGSAVKYIARAGRKDDIVQDLKKAQEFIQFEIDAILDERDEEEYFGEEEETIESLKDKLEQAKEDIRYLIQNSRDSISCNLCMHDENEDAGCRSISGSRTWCQENAKWKE